MAIDGQLAEKVKARLSVLRKQAQADVMDHTGRTIAKDFAEVRFSGGYIRGLRDAMLIIDEEQEAIIKGDEK